LYVNDSVIVDEYYQLNSGIALTLPSGADFSVGTAAVARPVIPGPLRITNTNQPTNETLIIDGYAVSGSTWGALIEALPGGISTLNGLLIRNMDSTDGSNARWAIQSGAVSCALFVSNQNTTTPVVTNGPTGGQAVLRTLANCGLVFGTGNIARATIDVNGATTFLTPTSGVPVTINGIANTMMFSLEYPTSVATGAYLRFRDTTNALDRGYVGGGSTLFTGGLITDFGIAAKAGRLILSPDGGATSPFKLSTTGTVLSTPSAAGITMDIASGNAAAALRIGAGTATAQTMQMTAGVVLTTPTQGAVEYDGTVKYFSPGASTRGVDLVEYTQILNAAYTLTSQTAAQKLLNGTTNGAVTLPIGTYEFECDFSLTAMSATGASFGFAFGGAATFTQAWWASADKPVTLSAQVATAATTFNTAANTTIAPSTTSTNGWACIRGIIRVTVAGTVIPQVSLGVAAAAIVGINSYFRARPVGGSAFVSVGNWS
jgi:hypothetical protein